jgi:diguanylate cyclase (GGDEF)-like protein/putative nucleotidyltransferase with HDIG domain
MNHAHAGAETSTKGKLQVLLICVTAGAATAIAVLGNSAHSRVWTTFAALAAAAAIARLFVVRTTHNQSHHLGIVFVVAAALVLPPELVALVCVLQHVPEWIKERYAPETQAFSIANSTFAALGAWTGAHLVLGSYEVGVSSRTALAGVVAGVVFVLVHHGLLATMHRVVGGQSVRDTGLLSFESLSTDLMLAFSGVAIAVWWHESLWLGAVGAVPLVLIQRALSIPRLRAQASLDAKTGLYNAGHLNAALAEEIQRAARFGRPLSVIVADLDLLRKINNNYGHLSGDAVLRGVAEALGAELRPYDVAARFGGEEFAVLLPETEVEEALVIAERIRAAVEGQLFRRHGSDDEVAVTLSLGVASYPLHAQDADELVHQADLALYRSKALGRNRVCGATVETRALNRLLGDPGRGADGVPTSPAPRGFRPYGPDRALPVEPHRIATALETLRRRFSRPRVARAGAPLHQALERARASAAEIQRATEELRRSNAYLAESNQRVRRTHVATIAALSRSMETKVRNTESHTERVASIAVALARRLGYRGEELDAIELGTLLHDIGKIGVPDSVLRKRGELSEDDWNAMREHPVISDYILSEVDLHPYVREIARWSHERIDGQGYPDGLAGEAIPLTARLAHVADAFDALTSDRPYRPGRSIPAALGELQEHTGSQFCPIVVDALEQIWDEEPQVLGNRHLQVVEDVA